MPVPTPDQLGPLGALIGTWEGDEGVDFSFHHAEGQTGDTPYFERVTMNPFGPVDNGSQVLFGLDYRMAAWRKTELDGDPFHTEVGYWLWDAAASQVMRCFVVPRGITVIAGGTAAADATEWVFSAECGSVTYGVLSNLYEDANAKTVRYECKITVGDDTWSYDEDTVLEMSNLPELLHHTDRNTLKKVDD